MFFITWNEFFRFTPDVKAAKIRSSKVKAAKNKASKCSTEPIDLKHSEPIDLNPLLRTFTNCVDNLNHDNITQLFACYVGFFVVVGLSDSGVGFIVHPYDGRAEAADVGISTNIVRRHGGKSVSVAQHTHYDFRGDALDFMVWVILFMTVIV